MLLTVVLPLSLAFIMFSLGVGLVPADFGRVARMPRAFLIGAACQVVLLPLVAFALLFVFRLPPELAVGVMILACAPGGVTSNIITKLAGGAVALSVSLTAVVSLLSVVTVPLIVAGAVGYFLGAEAPEVDVTGLAFTMFALTAVPVGLGVALRRFATGLAERIERGVSAVATVLFVIIILGALVANWGIFVENLPVLGPLLIVLNLVMLGLGYAFARGAGLSRAERIAVAIEAGVQNGSLGITVGALVGGGETLGPFALASGVYGITMYLVTLPVVAWLRRRG
ncbi:bile acid:sodium symporter family protein [Roseobacter sp. HKCCA0434]|uniref:bile acid:sodium symporter family protein n=1 Tax=Roseobacter sp. HKCCA0434 TaxID=3079297 RepID=UPI002905B656|nr:bile acid:sodium symporter family protein [Roseobacter sp. HKCCA0434]